MVNQYDRACERAGSGQASWVDGGSYLVLVLSGSMDAAAIEGFSDRVLQRVRQSGSSLLILDMKDVDRVSSSFIRLLILLAREIGKRDEALFLVSLRDQARAVLELSRLDRYLCLANTVEEALALWQDHRKDAGVKTRDLGGSEFTAIGFHRLAGRSGCLAPFLRRPVPPWPEPSALRASGFGRDDLFGFIEAGSDPEISDLGPVYLGRHVFANGSLASRDTPETGFEPFEGCTVGRRCILLFGTPNLCGFVRCRWPEKGVPLSDLLADRLGLVAKAHPEAAGFTGFIVLHDLPGVSGPGPNGTLIGLSIGMAAPGCLAAGGEGLAQPGIDEEEGLILKGITLILQVPLPLDFVDMDILPVLERCLREGRIVESASLRVQQPVGRAMVGMSLCGTRDALER